MATTINPVFLGISASPKVFLASFEFSDIAALSIRSVISACFSIESRKETTTGLRASEASRIPPILLGETIASAVALRSFLSDFSSIALDIIRRLGLRFLAVKTTNRLFVSLSSVAMSPLAFFILAISRFSSFMASPIT